MKPEWVSFAIAFGVLGCFSQDFSGSCARDFWHVVPRLDSFHFWLNVLFRVV